MKNKIIPVKPKKSKKDAYSYIACSDYLEQKYGYDERDYGGCSKYQNACKKETDEKFGENGWWTEKPEKYTKEQKKALNYYEKLMKKEPPYLDFWHFILDHHDIHNGSYFTMDKELMEDAEDWQKEILQHYFDEFDPKDTGEIEFWVAW